jgi:hypothetical protein
MKIVRKIGSLIASPVTVPASIFIKSAGTQISRAKSILVGIEERKQAQNDPAAIAVMMHSKKELLKRWGINNDDEEKRVIKGIMVEAAFYAVLALLPVLAVITKPDSWMNWFGALTASPVLFYVSSTKVWRHDCIVEGRLMPYRHWLFGRSR